nr:retrovirus-related Pol polyprotein from transposon TNT 1-94 [Tanacetum cinerariifolium]
MHNNIMVAGLRDGPLMLAPRRYAQWRSRFMRCIDTKDNCKALKKCLKEGPYVPSTVINLAKPTIETSKAVEEHSEIETLANMSNANKAHFKAKKEAIYMLLTGIRDEIYSTVDVCNTAHEMWIATKRLQVQKGRLNLLHMDLCGPMRVASINGKKYILDCTAMSSAEAKEVALSASCAQVMWMRTELKDYGFNYNKIPLYCDSRSAIAISCNPVQHFRTKHIHTRYHFIKEHVENNIIELYLVRTEYQLADMFTKALPEDRFQYLVRRIGMRCLTPAKLEVLENESA